MSTIFYDRLIVFDDLDKKIKKIAQTNEERQELWKMVEELIHHKVMGCCLHNLPKEHHQEFLDKFYTSPHDESLLTYLKTRVQKDMETIIKEELKNLVDEIKSLAS